MGGLDTDGVGDFLEVFDLVEVHVAVDLVTMSIDDAHVLQVLLTGRDAAQAGANSGQLGRTQEHVGVLPRRLGKLRVLVDMTVAPSRTCAWLPMHSEQPGISMRAPAVPKEPELPSLVCSAASYMDGGATHWRDGPSRYTTLMSPAARAETP